MNDDTWTSRDTDQMVTWACIALLAVSVILTSRILSQVTAEVQFLRAVTEHADASRAD